MLLSTSRSVPHRADRYRAARPATAVISALAMLWLLAVAALAAADRVVVEDGADEVDRGALIAEVERLDAEGLLLSVSVLADEPSGGATAEADRIVDARGGAALVITLTEVGGVSDDAGHDTSGAVDRALDELAADDDIVAATAAFGDHLLGAGASGGVADGAGDVDLPGIGGVSTTLIIIAVIGLVLLLSVFRFIGRLFGGGRRRGYHRGGARRGGGMLPGAAVGYGVGRMRGNRNRGVGGTMGGMSGGTSRGGTSRGSASRGSASRSRSSGSRSRSSGSRGGRSRGSGRRR